MATLAELVVKIAGDAEGFRRAMGDAEEIATTAAGNIEGKFKAAGSGLQDFGGKAQALGGKLTAGVTLPLAGVATAAIAAGTSLNESMANVASLDVAEDRVMGLKTGVQELAIATGKSTGDIAGGVYQVISAFGDSADTLEIVEINARAAAAGLAKTEEAINLTSAVTKGYGDTSAGAVQATADLAFQTVKLGQTTFPELAAALGKVVPLAATLGVKQEELFAATATLTGVTGNAAEVTTQLRATYQAFLKPTTDMAEGLAEVALQLDEQGRLAGGPLVESWKTARDRFFESQMELSSLEHQLSLVNTETDAGAKAAKELEKRQKELEKAVGENEKAFNEAAAAMGSSVVESVGMTEALGLLEATTGGNTNQLGKMFGSVESLNAVLALSGAQAETYEEKLAEMTKATGASQEAFEAQTEGINEAGFAMAQARAKGQVLLEKLGDGLAPALIKVLDAAEPLIDALVVAADKFANMDERQQSLIVTIGALAAAIGPAMVVLGSLVSSLGTVISVVGTVVGAIGGAAGLSATIAAVANPIGVVVAAVAGLALAWSNDWLGMRTATIEAVDRIKAKWDGWIDSIGRSGQTGLQNIGNAFGNLKDNVSAKTDSLWSTIESRWQSGMDRVNKVGADGLSKVEDAFSKLPNDIGTLFGDLVASVKMRATEIWDAFKDRFDRSEWTRVAKDVIDGVITGITSSFGSAIEKIRRFGEDLLSAFKRSLGIGSPSRLFALAGASIVEGLAMGIDSRRELAAGVMAGVMGAIMPGQMGMGMGVGGIGTSTSNNYYNLTIHSQARSEDIISDFHLLASAA